jgi:MerR family transcriptional regulator, light-induced transcriptional regulator
VSDDIAARLPPVDPSEAGRPHPATLTPELLAGLLADGDDELAAWVLRDALAERSRAEVYDGLLRDAMTLVGDRWATGQWTVADEHLASQTVLRSLDAVRPTPGPERRVEPLAVLAGVAGERHTIGLICLDHVLQENGWTVADLGGDVPTDDLARFVAANEVALVALAASDAVRAPVVAAAAAAARAARPLEPRLPVMVGGRVVGDADAIAALDVDFAGGSLVEAAAFARRLAARHA